MYICIYVMCICIYVMYICIYIYMSTCYVGKKLIKAYVYCSLYARLKIKVFVFVLYNVLLMLFVMGLMTGFFLSR